MTKSPTIVSEEGLAHAVEYETKYLHLADGRQLAYAEYGDPAGLPLFLFHGTPGCRLPIPGNVPIAGKLGVRVIVPDRPGYGRSTPHPQRTLLGWPDEVVALADHLDIDQFAVVGNSGGACHAAACLFKLQNRILTTALVGCPPPPHLKGVAGRVPAKERLIVRAGERAPWLLYSGTSLVATLCCLSPAIFLHMMAAQVSLPDRKLLRMSPHRPAMMRRYREAYRQGGIGHAQDLVLMSRDWGFDLADLQGDVRLWHGDSDHVFPTNVTRLLADHIPGAPICWVKDAGHLLLERPGVWRQILGDMLRR